MADSGSNLSIYLGECSVDELRFRRNKCVMSWHSVSPGLESKD